MSLHEGRRDEDGLRGGCRVSLPNDAEEIDGGGAAHVIKRLAHGGEAWANGGGGRNIVEADDGDITRDVKACLVECGDGAHGGDIIESEDGGEGLAARDECASSLIAWFGSGLDSFQLHDELGIDGDVEFGADFADGIPAGGCIGTEALPLDKGDAAMAERGEVVEGVPCGGKVVEFNGDDTFAVLVAGDGDNGNLEVVVDGCVDGDNAFDRAGEQQARVALDEIGSVAVTDYEVEVFLLEERVFNAAEYGGGVAFTDFRNHDADGEAALVAELACDGVGLVVEEGGGLEDALLRFGRDTVLVSCGVHDAGDGALGEAEVRGEFLELDGSGSVGLRSRSRRGAFI